MLIVRDTVVSIIKHVFAVDLHASHLKLYYYMIASFSNLYLSVFLMWMKAWMLYVVSEELTYTEKTHVSDRLATVPSHIFPRPRIKPRM